MVNIKFIHFANIRTAVLVVAISCGLISQVHTASADSFAGVVTRALFTTELKKSQPANEVLVLENDILNLYFFSKVEGMQGKTIVHSWEHRGETVFEKKFQVNRQSENLVSNFKLSPERTGEWMVVMTDDRGRPIKAVMFKYVKKGSFAGKGVVPVKF